MAEKPVITNATKTTRPPIVAVLGHVDHGKTSLLDYIRKTKITEGEAGGITQHIGAYQVEISNLKSQLSNQNKITFIDTPGHEAFAKMRSRGATIADIAILVVAATEGVKPQTEESIKHIKAAGIPIIVAMNKMDLPQANPDRTKGELARVGVLVEKFGGDVVIVPVSAKTGMGVDKLLEAILLVAAMNELTTDPTAPFEGVIIESKMDKSKGPLATVIVKSGKLTLGNTIYVENTEAKVRSMTDSLGKSVKEAYSSMPVEVMGWKEVPAVGAQVVATKQVAKISEAKFVGREFALPPLETMKKLRMILKTDVAGSLEAITESLGEEVEIVRASVGEINESDILLAKSTGSVVIGFNVRPNAKLTDFAKTEKVRIKVYTIIYELLDEIHEVSQLLNKPEAIETILGEATIAQEFEFGSARIAGCQVTSGRVARNDAIKLLRKDNEIARSRIKSLRTGKADVPKVEANNECGIIFDKKLDFRLGDRIIAFKEKELLA